MNRDELLGNLKEILAELFEVPAGKVVPEAKLSEDLDLDSIDAIDLVVRLQSMTGKRVNPEDFKTVRTVNDVLNAIEKLQRENGPASA